MAEKKDFHYTDVAVYFREGGALTIKVVKFFKIDYDENYASIKSDDGQSYHMPFNILDAIFINSRLLWERKE